jgi:hypothetical protein
MVNEKLTIIALLIVSILIGSLLCFSAINSKEWKQEAKDRRINIGNELDEKASKDCVEYGMKVLKGIYLRDVLDIPEHSICIREKADGGLEYYYLTGNGVPVPLSNTCRIPY